MCYSIGALSFVFIIFIGSLAIFQSVSLFEAPTPSSTSLSWCFKFRIYSSHQISCNPSCSFSLSRSNPIPLLNTTQFFTIAYSKTFFSPFLVLFVPKNVPFSDSISSFCFSFTRFSSFSWFLISHILISLT